MCRTHTYTLGEVSPSICIRNASSRKPPAGSRHPTAVTVVIIVWLWCNNSSEEPPTWTGRSGEEASCAFAGAAHHQPGWLIYQPGTR